MTQQKKPAKGRTQIIELVAAIAATVFTVVIISIQILTVFGKGSNPVPKDMAEYLPLRLQHIVDSCDNDVSLVTDEGPVQRSTITRCDTIRNSDFYGSIYYFRLEEDIAFVENAHPPFPEFSQLITSVVTDTDMKSSSGAKLFVHYFYDAIANDGAENLITSPLVVEIFAPDRALVYKPSLLMTEDSVESMLEEYGIIESNS